jgi:hypothetical protein
MADIINLNRYRHQRARKARDAEAQNNRARFGEIRVDRIKRESELARAKREFEGKRLDNGDD